MKNTTTEIKTFKLDVEEKSRETIINNEVFDVIVIQDYWDSHGEMIIWNDEDDESQHVFEKAKILVEKVKRVYHFEHTGDSEYEFYELTINGKEYDNGEITHWEGNKKHLVIYSCIGAG